MSKKKIKIKLLQNRIDILLLNQKVEKMAKAQEILSNLVNRLDGATNEIASDLKKLRDDLTAQGENVVSPETLATLDSNIGKLESMGKDPEQPIPPTEPTQEPPVGTTGDTGTAGDSGSVVTGPANPAGPAIPE